jgi:hypothetical protein
LLSDEESPDSWNAITPEAAAAAQNAPQAKATQLDSQIIL